MSSRKKLIAGNWKMNKTPAEGVTLVRDIVAAAGKQTDVEVVVCRAAFAAPCGVVVHRYILPDRGVGSAQT